MSVYLGESGAVEIRRQGEPVEVVLGYADVSAEFRRFSLDFDPIFDGPRPSPLITGDQVEFRTVDGTDLVLVEGMTDSSVTRWVHIDQMGGIRLYDTYETAINGGISGAIPLVEPTADQEIIVDVVNVLYNCIAQMRNWEITTTRETVDTTILGEEYRHQYDQGLISGQGSINAIWDYKFSNCEDEFESDSELAHYFSHLVIRFREGARFKAYFFVYRSATDSVWYECDCICTSVGMSFAPGQVIDSTIQFVTTGQIWLKQGQPPGYILQEDNSLIDLEQGPGSLELEFDA